MPLQAPGPDVRLARTHGPPSCVVLCVSLWFFVFLAVEGLALWACTVISKIFWQSCVR